MRSGSPTPDGSGWPSAQRPHSNEGLGNQGRYGSGARSEPQDGLGSGRREVPEIRDPALPSHQGPSHQGSAYQAPGYAGSACQPQSFAPPPGSGQDIWPVTGAQEALPDTGPQPVLRGDSPRGSTAYPEQWYDSPRLDDRAQDDRAPRDSRPSRSPDPRLAGMTYGELRY